ncbi:stage 0 sporulation family protein [Jeotgalibaca sp. MA1X17-3]|uniref:PSP1 domain-containing protein n=1 Tax=Jeotgalibaca sp. MA1X17-3 TaxID=2908211 RepID=UPI001F377EA7|nr:stage 0 sporulation family protein [Jeotgalibaca sp. MA1X17-3]UJF15881.1 stage 0 sporulation family protein [Jeotgalibaca sp. MA1X17-3]
MKQVIGLRFIPNGPLSYYEKGNDHFQINDQVIVQQSEYEEMGRISIPYKECQDEDVTYSHDQIIRKATQLDVEKNHINKKDAEKAQQICKQKVREFGLEMKIIQSTYSFDRKKLTFLFSSNGRVDFRKLVRELASIFRVRIELRQIGARDETKILGGIGPCGRPLCCSTFLGDFVPVSIKMAKDQGLSLNTSKISGLCGRLLCCLNFENENYEEMKKLMPDYGEEVETPDGRGKVVGLNLISQVIKVRLFSERKTLEYAWEEIMIPVG